MGSSARYLEPLPRDFQPGTYKFRSTPSGTLPTDQDIARTVSYGVPGTMMPAFADVLSDSDTHDVVAYIKTFSTRFAREGAGTAIVVPTELSDTEASVEEGQRIYMVMSCWSCHGSDGKGEGASVATMQDDWGNPVTAFDFTSGIFRGGSDSGSIFKTFWTGLNGTPMPAYAGNFLFASGGFSDLSSFGPVYTDEEITALRSYLSGQPTQSQLDGMSQAERQAIADRRAWALVHFVQSLTKTPGFWHKWFVADTEVTQAYEFQPPETDAPKKSFGFK